MPPSITSVVVTLAAVVACAPPSLESELDLASETVLRQQRIAAEAIELNTCNNEAVRLSGEVHIVITEKGSLRHGHINGHLTGTGSAGNDYVLNLQARTSVQPGSDTVEFVGRQVLISKGGAPNLLTTVSITSDPFSMSVQADCRG